MHLVDNDTFLKQLSTVFEESNKSGKSVWLTHKRLTYTGDGDVKIKTEEGVDANEYPCLLRCTDGKKNHLSTHIMSKDLDKFHAAYGTILKNAMTSLRKRDKKKEKERAERIAQKQKRLSEPIIVEGSKRGAGRRKRQRRMKAALKQADARRKTEERQAKTKA